MVCVTGTKWEREAPDLKVSWADPDIDASLCYLAR